jgi:hypothetical protein
MARAKRLLGNVKPILRISGLAASPSATFDASDDAEKIEIVSGEQEARTFSERAEGFESKAISFEYTTSLDALSMWNVHQLNAGRTNVTIVWAPGGSLTPSANNPVFTLVGTMPPVPNLSTEQSNGEASATEFVFQADTYTVARA